MGTQVLIGGFASEWLTYGATGRQDLLILNELVSVRTIKTNKFQG
eukprot:SAG11_NODE_302_length_11005_cov_12.491748_1_plen_45_part_00